MTTGPPGNQATSGGVANSGQVGAVQTGPGTQINYFGGDGPPPPLAALHTIPPPPGDFVGRGDEIAALEAELRRAAAGGAAAAISGIRGLGGLGKTTLATVVATLLGDCFPDAQILLALRGARATPVPPEAALATVIHAFAPAAALPADLESLRALYLAALHGKRVLILADDAAGPEQVRPLLPPPGCALLVTSRQDFRLPGLCVHALDTLPAAAAVALVRGLCARLSDADAAALARLCGGLPLALRAAASLLDVERHRPVAGYLAALADERTRLAALRAPDDPDLDVEASLGLSWAALPTPGQAVLAQLSVFPAPFDAAAARAVVALDTVQHGDTEALAPLAGPRRTDEREDEGGASVASADPEADARLMAALGDLGRRSLLEYDEAGGRYRLHDLVRVFAAARLPAADADVARWRHAEHFAPVTRETDRLYQEGGEALMAGLALFDRERAQIDAGWAWVRAQAAATRAQADPLLVDYAGATVYIGDLRYDARRERIPQLEAALAAARRLGRDEGWLLGNLGLAYAALGEPRRAIAYYEQHLEIARAIGDRQGEGNALGNLGNAYYLLGEPRRAIEYYEQQLEVARADGDRRGEGHALGSLGNAYVALGEPRRAIASYEQRLEIAQAIGDRRGEGAALGGLGVAYATLGEPRRAIPYYEQTLEIARGRGDRQGEANSSWNLGLLLAAEGDPAAGAGPDLARAVVLLQVRVDFLRALGHPDAEPAAAMLEGVRARLAAGG